MSNVLIREVQIEDARGMARVHAAAWKIAYRGTFLDEMLDGLSEETGAPRFVQ